MGSDDGTDSELDKYAPKWVRERPAAPKRLSALRHQHLAGPKRKIGTGE
jgi:hypothetical protein